ncbi:RagB/SusD family nutrient uptake outer membrane protein [Flammeovirga yaeyamensis]|uniref:RagB/SusD family nutrient uptake outer membrane protein n=1 Tax=Flammeovirga yaeyamensis TaxID=367791 RepID=A0AAX1NFL4_9BACT|nr:RagB/SusD family nutrient uptake outer membrane protein [Flammeovirga yaeyamensis]MBB3696630.1 hypothetical protein [Flammeovirga yaeyamensis]NMF33303.1 RagB/SusD family nutrient uptake outer membrane protein [Flammeovirga yaeyamensis]QWG05418.1 RagB/SusD family nutrient uptake outer membrane protein [Flammeovirga yaeyamensis]
MKGFRNIRWAISLLVPMYLLTGCDHLLSVEPDSQIGVNQFWKTENDARSGVAAIYDAAQDAYGYKYFIWGELRSDNFGAHPNAEKVEAIQLTGNDLTDQNENYGGWGEMYNMILKANLAIENIPNITGDINSQLGQAYALRSFAYFDLVRAYGDVPLYTSIPSGLDDDIFREKTSADVIMNEIVIPDMLKAEELLTTPKDRFTFSKSSIYCLQAEVYMHIGEHGKAKEVLDKLVAMGEFSLVNTAEEFHALFRNEPERAGLSSNQMETGPELIFSIVYNLEQDLKQSDVYKIFWPGVPAYAVSKSLEEKWNATFPTDSIEWVTKYPDFTPSAVDDNGRTIYGDYFRYVQMIEGDKEIGEKRYGKYNLVNYPAADDDTDIVVYRYAGMLLLLAEAEVQLGNYQVAVDLVNRIRSNRDLPQISILDYPTKNDLLNAVLDERQFELIGEGKRWHDLRRTNKVVEVMNPINGQEADRLLFPIWFQHMVDNPNITQNSGY